MGNPASIDLRFAHKLPVQKDVDIQFVDDKTAVIRIGDMYARLPWTQAMILKGAIGREHRRWLEYYESKFLD